jgi:hypothetical protein
MNQRDVVMVLMVPIIAFVPAGGARISTTW